MLAEKSILLSRRENESKDSFLKRVSRFLYDVKVDFVNHMTGSTCERYYRVGESVPSHTFYVYEVDEAGNCMKIEED